MAGYNHWKQLAAALPKVAASVVRETAQDVADLAAANAPVDTGFLKSSVYTVTAEGSTYGQAGTPPGDAYLLPEVDAPENEQTAYVAVGANYGIYQEMGTRFMPPQPYFYPAVEAGKVFLDDALSKMEDALQGAIV